MPLKLARVGNLPREVENGFTYTHSSAPPRIRNPARTVPGNPIGLASTSGQFGNLRTSEQKIATSVIGSVPWFSSGTLAFAKASST